MQACLVEARGCEGVEHSPSVQSLPEMGSQPPAEFPWQG